MSVVTISLTNDISLGQYKDRTPISNPEVRLPHKIEEPTMSRLRHAIRSGDKFSLERHMETFACNHVDAIISEVPDTIASWLDKVSREQRMEDFTCERIDAIIGEVPEKALVRSGLKEAIVNWLDRFTVPPLYLRPNRTHRDTVLIYAHARGHLNLMTFMLGPAMNLRIQDSVFIDVFCYGYGSIVTEILRTHTFDQIILNAALDTAIWCVPVGVSQNHPEVTPRLPKIRALIEAGANTYSYTLETALQRVPNQHDVHEYLRSKLSELEVTA